MTEIDRQFQYFIDNQNMLVKDYEGKVIILHNNAVAGAFDSNSEAYLFGKRSFDSGTFIMQKCVNGPEVYTTVISTLGIIS